MQTRLAPFIPEIPASAVAAVIGLNPYRAPYEAMYAILKKDKILKDQIQELERVHRRVSLDTVRRKVAAHSEVRAIVQRGLTETETNPDVPGIVERAKTSIELLTNLRYPSLPPSVRASIVKECASDIHKQRGTKNENEVLNQYETRTKTQVTERNTCMRTLKCGEYTLCGRIDGYIASRNRIVDSKERTVHWPDVPVYDEIQMRVYMELMGCPEAELVERFPNGTVRNTVFERDDSQWSQIHSRLTSAARDMILASQDRSALLKIIEANTFKDSEPSTPNASHAEVNYII